ncbi:FLYWCH-type zinc finger-containing protein 1-like [Choristoneura fumiferana]|uniref:FLYWCH-type zinc finger-containing protein 1-like n=1 Tax=Choristoneura fumiferana TaxID=7141 RepID=UPI003D1562FC
MFFGETCKGGRYIYYRGYKYHKEKQSGLKTRWYCGTHRRLGCHGAISTIEDDIIKCNDNHNHPEVHYERF